MAMRIHKRAIIRTGMSTSGEIGSMVLLTRLSRLVYKAASEDALGMKLKAYVTLTTLRNGPMPQQELCISMHLDPNNCVLLLNEMEAAGHVRRSRDPADRRRHIVEITDDGRSAVARSDEALNEVEGQVLGNLSAEERASLRSLLNRAMAEQPVAA
jgi:DNA-binding MarR family transcriptional regulator